jgi:hypothetical protein
MAKHPLIGKYIRETFDDPDGGYWIHTGHVIADLGNGLMLAEVILGNPAKIVPGAYSVISLQKVAHDPLVYIMDSLEELTKNYKQSDHNVVKLVQPT